MMKKTYSPVMRWCCLLVAMLLSGVSLRAATKFDAASRGIYIINGKKLVK